MAGACRGCGAGREGVLHETRAVSSRLDERFKVHTKATPKRVREAGVPKVTKVAVYHARERLRARGKSSPNCDWRGFGACQSALFHLGV